LQFLFRRMTEVVTPSITADPSNPTTAIIIGVIVGLVLLILVVLCLCRFRKRDRYDSKMSTLQSKASSSDFHSPTDLIPPVFYTPEMRDPLLQEDLRDNVHSSSKSIYI
jgi:hypothetical protein